MTETDCVFCSIVVGRAPAHIVHRDDVCVAFLSRPPIRSGHVLVVPRAHAAVFLDLVPDAFADLMRGVHHVAGVVDRVMRPVRVGILVAGFDVPHTHVHVVPMHDYHDLTSRAILDQAFAPSDEASLAEVARRLRDD